MLSYSRINMAAVTVAVTVLLDVTQYLGESLI